MHHENKYPRNLETTHPNNESADSSGTNTAETEPARTGGTSPINGKKRGFFRPAFVITGMALSMGLTSCVDPYMSPGGSSVSVTSYRPGYTINSLPGGYRSENISGSTYYYHNGSYYRQGDRGYMVVEAPRTSRYYDDYSRLQRTYSTQGDYRQTSSGYDPRYDRGQIITRLPDGYRTLNHRGSTYYRVGDQYYLRQNNGYVITTSPY